jgi:glycosyltransferase involved in cell wall biosynthesis
LRIGLIIYGHLNIVTGGFIYDRNLVTHSKQLGDEVHIISLPWRKYKNHLAYNFSNSLIRRIASLKLDILLEDELNHPSCIILNKVLKNKVDHPLISIVHHLRMEENNRPLHSFQKWLEKEYLKSVDGFIFNSLATSDSVARFVDDRPYIVAYPGKDRFLPEITEREIVKRCQRAGPLGIVFLGNITPRKGLDVLISSLKSLSGAQWRLTVIGSLSRSKKYSREILEQIQTHEISKSVYFTGEISNAEVAAILRNNHVLAVPSHHEGFGLVYVEAMGFGLPVIGTSAGGAQEIIKHQVNGFLIAPQSSASLTEYLLRLHADRSMLERMSFDALKTYSMFPTWHGTASKIRGFLQTMKN